MKFLLEVNDRKYVVDSDTLTSIYSSLKGLEGYCRKWNRGEGNEESFYSHHVYTHAPEEDLERLEVLPDEVYAVAKLAGKPNN
jgi:hypothetical protein